MKKIKLAIHKLAGMTNIVSSLGTPPIQISFFNDSFTPKLYRKFSSINPSMSKFSTELKMFPQLTLFPSGGN